MGGIEVVKILCKSKDIRNLLGSSSGKTFLVIQEALGGR